MNSVQSLRSKPFRSRSSAERKEVKRLGRPTPNLDITQSVSSKSRTFTRIFNTDVYAKYKWICGCEVNNALFCFPCLLFGSYDSWATIGVKDLNHLMDRIGKHVVTAKHMKNVLKYSLFGSEDISPQLDSKFRDNIRSHNENVRKNRYILNIMIDCMRSSDPGIYQGFNFSSNFALLENSSVFKVSSKIIQKEILQAMFNVCQEQISKEIQEADYLSLIVDGTAIIFRYITNGRPVERFWDFLTLSDCNAITISSGILAELEKILKDDKQKLIAHTYDGAAVMGGVQAIVKQNYGQAVYVDCYSHQLNLVMLNAASAKNNVRIFVANLHGISRFFSDHPERIAVLDRIVKSPTKWRFNSSVVYTVFENRDSVIRALRTILNSSFITNTINEASGYIQILKSRSFTYWLIFFYKIMPHVDQLSAIFQTINIDPVIAMKFILSFEAEMEKIRHGITESPVTNGESMKRRKIEENGSLRETREVCDVIIRLAKNRFRFTGHLTAEQLLFPEKYVEYTTSFPEKLFKETIKIYPYFNPQKFRTELSVIYEEFKSISGILPLYQLISTNTQLSETFNETLKLLKILITIPMVSDEPERCFTTLERLRDFLRNAARQEGLSALAMLALEKDLMESIPDFNQRVIETFASSEDRRDDFLFKDGRIENPESDIIQMKIEVEDPLAIDETQITSTTRKDHFDYQEQSSSQESDIFVTLNGEPRPHVSKLESPDDMNSNESEDDDCFDHFSKFIPTKSDIIMFDTVT